MAAQRTPQDFLDELAEKDLTVAEWARRKKLPRHVVYDVLNGRLLGRRGVARKVVKAMRLAPPAMPAQRQGAPA